MGTDDSKHDFRAMIERYAAPLGRLCCAYEADRARSQDLYQDILLALWRALPDFRRQCSERTWVYRIAHNVAITFSSRSARERVRGAQSIEAFQLASDQCDGFERVAVQELMQQVQEVLAELKPIDQEIALLFLEGVSPAEMSDVTGLSRENVSTRLWRIKQVLQRRIHGSDRHVQRSR